jgi:hypothetical protein
MAAERMAAILWLRVPFQKLPFPDTLWLEQKLALYVANEIGRLLLMVNNAYF